VLGVAWWLIRSRRDVYDGRLLLLIETLFLADGTFLLGELLSSHGRVGLIVAAAVLALIPFKLLIIARILDVPVAWWRLPVVVRAPLRCASGRG